MNQAVPEMRTNSCGALSANPSKGSQMGVGYWRGAGETATTAEDRVRLAGVAFPAGRQLSVRSIVNDYRRANG
jgi:hypothetical protein